MENCWSLHWIDLPGHCLYSPFLVRQLRPAAHHRDACNSSMTHIVRQSQGAPASVRCERAPRGRVAAIAGAEQPVFCQHRDKSFRLKPAMRSEQGGRPVSASPKLTPRLKDVRDETSSRAGEFDEDLRFVDKYLKPFPYIVALAAAKQTGMLAALIDGPRLSLAELGEAGNLDESRASSLLRLLEEMEVLLRRDSGE